MPPEIREEIIPVLYTPTENRRTENNISSFYETSTTVTPKLDKGIVRKLINQYPSGTQMPKS